MKAADLLFIIWCVCGALVLECLENFFGVRIRNLVANGCAIVFIACLFQLFAWALLDDRRPRL